MSPGELVLPIAAMGAPTILIERLYSENQMLHCIKTLNNLLTSSEYNVETGHLNTTGRFLEMKK